MTIDRWIGFIGTIPQATHQTLHNRKRGELFPKYELTRRTQPFVQHRCINAAKIGVEFQITIVEIDQARVFPEQPRLYSAADKKHRRRRTVIGATIRIFRDASPELAEGHQQYTLEISLLL